MNAEDHLLVLATDLKAEGREREAGYCLKAAYELERLYAERRHYIDSAQRNRELRVEAQARAGRIARDARR